MGKVVAAIDEKIAQLQEKVDRWTADGMTVWLYVNDHEPTPYDTLADYSVCSVEGVNGLAASWPYPPSDQGDGTAQVRGVPLVYTPTGTAVVQTAYGWYAVNNATGLFQFGQRRDTPLVDFGSTLDPITIVPFYDDEDVA